MRSVPRRKILYMLTLMAFLRPRYNRTQKPPNPLFGLFQLDIELAKFQAIAFRKLPKIHRYRSEIRNDHAALKIGKMGGESVVPTKKTKRTRFNMNKSPIHWTVTLVGRQASTLNIFLFRSIQTRVLTACQESCTIKVPNSALRSACRFQNLAIKAL